MNFRVLWFFFLDREAITWLLIVVDARDVRTSVYNSYSKEALRFSSPSYRHLNSLSKNGDKDSNCEHSDEAALKS